MQVRAVKRCPRCQKRTRLRSHSKRREHARWVAYYEEVGKITPTLYERLVSNLEVVTMFLWGAVCLLWIVLFKACH